MTLIKSFMPSPCLCICESQYSNLIHERQYCFNPGHDSQPAQCSVEASCTWLIQSGLFRLRNPSDQHVLALESRLNIRSLQYGHLSDCEGAHT